MSTPTMPAERLLPSPSDDQAWGNPTTVPGIAYWQDTVNPAAHTLAHPSPVQGCPGCPPVTACSWCGLPPGMCADLAGHRRLTAAREVVTR